MQYNRKLPLLAAAAGMVGAGLRAVQLATGFELTTGLYISGGLWGRLLTGWLVLTAVLCLILARKGRHHSSFENLFGSSSELYKMAAALCGLLLAAGGALWLVVELRAMRDIAEDTSTWILALEVPFGALCVAAGLCFIGLGAALSRRKLEASHALLTLPPLFWAAFHLLVAYRQYCVSANLALFTVEIFASIACVMAYYHFARMLYGKPAPQQFAFWAAMAAALTLTDVLGYLLSVLLGGSVVRWTLGALVRGGCLMVGTLFLYVELCLLTSRDFAYSPAPAESSPDEAA